MWPLERPFLKWLSTRAVILIAFSLLLGGTLVQADEFDALLRQAQKLQDQNSQLSRALEMLASEANEPLDTTLHDNIVLPADRLLQRMPEHLVGWMQWRDRKTDIDISMVVANRYATSEWVIFEGEMEYFSHQSQKTTRSYGFLYIDPITASMRLVEVEQAEQEDFDDQGAFVGFVDPATLMMNGTWSKQGYHRIADFELGPAKGD